MMNHHRKQKLNVLVIEYEVCDLELLAVNLSSKGYVVSRAKSLTEAGLFMQSIKPDIFVCDLGYHGSELDRLICSAQINESFIVATSKEPMSAFPKQLLQAIDVFLLKPVDIETLIRFLDIYCALQDHNSGNSQVDSLFKVGNEKQSGDLSEENGGDLFSSFESAFTEVSAPPEMELWSPQSLGI